MSHTRLESDLLGARDIPTEAYWGIHTLRAIHNFSISKAELHPALARALATVKQACAATNQELGYLDKRLGSAITQAAREISQGALADQFPVNPLQGGAGTSSNMNANEVIANRALEILGEPKGNYALIHPIEHINLHQSTNDVYPTALHIAAIFAYRKLSETIAKLQGAFQAKEKEWASILKIGRTELQEAVPITLGMEFSAYAEALSRDRWRTYKCEERLRVINLGGTAIGTGLTAPREYIFLATEKLREITGLGLSRGENLAGETANADVFVEVSGILKAHAVTLIKISRDLRLLNLLGEIHLPPLQAGSSIMPGKVNPVMLEMTEQVGLKVIANDLIITECAARGSLQICEFLPLLAHALLESLDLLNELGVKLAEHILQIEADEARCRENLDRSHSLATALVPEIGYVKATAILKEFLKPETRERFHADFRAFLTEKLGVDLVKRVLTAQNLTRPSAGGER